LGIKVFGDFRLEAQLETVTVTLSLFLINSMPLGIGKGGLGTQFLKLEAGEACLTATKNKSQPGQHLNPFWPNSRQQTKGRTQEVKTKFLGWEHDVDGGMGIEGTGRKLSF